MFKNILIFSDIVFDKGRDILKDKVNFNKLFHGVRKTWPYAKKYKKYLIMYSLVILILIGISVVVPLLSARLLLNITDSLLEKVLLVALVIFVLEINRNIFNFLSSKLSQLFYINVLNDIQTDLAKETLELDIKEIDKHSSGVFIDRLSKDARDMADVFEMIIYYLMQILENIGVLGAILIIDRTLFVYTVIVLLVLFIFEKIRIGTWYEYDKIRRELDEKNSGLIAELVRGIRDVKVLNSANDFMKKIITRVKEANRQQYKLSSKMRQYNLLTGSLSDLSTLLFIVLGVYLITNNKLTIDNFVIIYMYQSRTYNLLMAVTNLAEQSKHFTLASDRIFEIIDGKFAKEKFGDKHLNKVDGNFEFKNVNFAYDGKSLVLKDLSFKISPNETVAFVGKSGGGKTTIFSLIDRLYRVNDGEILIDDININDLDKDSIRDNISIITQNPYIFNFTIKENLKIAKNDATLEEMIEVCKIARLHDYIMSLPEDYDTLIGEGGLNLSGGQRQRLAIARALLKKTEIILFDEATSALDNETQKEIKKAIDSLKGEYTILIIAHRLSTVINSDRILLIDDGKVIDEGTHDELMKKSKVYRDLYETELVN